MIANFTGGGDPGGLARYLLGYKGEDQKTKKQATVLGSAGVRTDTLAHLITDFELGMQLHPELGQSVLHISLSFNPDDAARMTDKKMCQVAEEYLDEMGLAGTQYLLVRHRDRPHQHLHIMANRVADDGHTVEDSNNFIKSKEVLAKLIAVHELTPADKNRPHLQHPKRLRGADLGRYELRAALDQALETDKQTQRPALLAALAAKGITHREFHDKDGNATGISFQKSGYACKGSALGPEYSSAGIDRRLAVNQQNSLEAAGGQVQSLALPDLLVAAAPATAVQPVVPPVPVAAEEQSMVSSPVQPPAEAAKAKLSEVSAPVEVRLTPPVDAAVFAVRTQESEQSVPVQVGSASSVSSDSLSAGEAPVGGERSVVLAMAGERPTDQEAKENVPNAVVPAKTDEVPLVGTATTEHLAISETPEQHAHPRYATQAEQGDWDRKLAAWEEEQAAEARYEAYAVRYNDLLQETTRKIALADEATYQSLPAFEALLQTHGLALLPAAGEEPVRVVHRSSGEEFPAEDILLAGRPFLDTVQAKIALAEAPAAPAAIDWEPRYQQYVEERAAVLAQNAAVLRVSYLLQDNPNAAGVASAIALVQAPGTPPLGHGSLLLNLQGELTRQQTREDEIRWDAREHARLQEVAKGKFGFGYTPAAMDARTRLKYWDAPTPLPLNVGEQRFLKPEPPALTLKQFAQQHQPGFEEVQATVKATLAAGFTEWYAFKARVERSGIEATQPGNGIVAFRHKASGQTYRSDEVVTNFRERYDKAKAQGQAQEAKQPQRNTPALDNDREHSR